MSPRVVLVGPPGADVPAVALELGRRTGLPVRDTDQDVENAVGMTVADVFVERGEPYFRGLERQAVVEALSNHDGILVLGGGAVMDPLTESELADHHVVYLAASVAHAARVLGFSTQRPSHLVNPRAQWQRMMQARQPVYERVATTVVTVDGRSVEDVAGEVASSLSL